MEEDITVTSRGQFEAGRRVTLIGMVINLFLIVFKFLAGIYGQSQALVADAFHSVSDLVTDCVVLVGLRMGRRAPDRTHHFGHGRLETLTSAVIGGGLLGVAVYIGSKAVWDILRDIEHHPTWLAVCGAGLSVALKEALFQYTRRVGRSIRSMAVVANAWHHRSDAFSSVAVLLGVVGARMRPQWHILDAYAALVVSLLIVKVGLEIVWRSLRELIDTAPGGQVLEQIRGCAMRVPGVHEVHDLRVRTSGGVYQMEMHVVVDGGLTVRQGHAIAKAVEECLHQDFPDLAQVIIHVDPARGEELLP